MVSADVKKIVLAVVCGTGGFGSRFKSAFYGAVGRSDHPDYLI